MEFKPQKPVYRQIADFILENILAEVWKPGDRLQSVRDMAAEVQVTPSTVARTFTFLNKEGIIYSQKGVGYFITEDAREKAYAFQKSVFLETELPALFKTMDLLHIDFKELQAYHKKLYHENQQ